VEPDPEVIQACQKLKRAGYLIAMDDFVYQDRYRPLLELADFVKVDFLSTPEEARKALFEKISPLKARLVAEKVETPEMFRQGVDGGYAFFQGYFFSKPLIVVGKDIPTFKVRYLQLLQEIYHNRARPELTDGKQVQWIGKSTAVSPVVHKEPDGITVQARRLLQLAIDQDGPATVKIPGWRAAGMTSDVWQRVIGALRSAGVVETQAGEGTFIRYEHQTAAYALEEIQTGKVRVRPAPPPQNTVP